MAASQFFRIATEGATTDGRVIDAQWIKDIAETYDPKTFTAVVNCEHINGADPNGSFGSYGHVTAVKAEPVQLNIGGKQVTRLALYAQIEANDNLKAINQAGQKLFSSIEVEPQFASTSKAYLLGVAVTNTPASLGTEMMKFCAMQAATNPAANPIAHRKKSPTSLFTANEETTILFAAAGGGAGLVPNIAPDSLPADPLDWLKRLLGFSQLGNTPVIEPVAPVAPVAPVTPPASFMADPIAATAFSAVLAQMETDRANSLALQQRLTASEATQAELRTQLENTSAFGFRQRPQATGAEDAQRADC
jgi:hypothetical protein